MQKFRLHGPVRLARLCMTQTQNPNSQDQDAFFTIFKQACIYIGSNVACAKVGQENDENLCFLFLLGRTCGT